VFIEGCKGILVAVLLVLSGSKEVVGYEGRRNELIC